MIGIWDGYDGFFIVFPWFFHVLQEKSEVLQAVHGSNPHVPGTTRDEFHVISRWLDLTMGDVRKLQFTTFRWWYLTGTRNDIRWNVMTHVSVWVFSSYDRESHFGNGGFTECRSTCCHTLYFEFGWTAMTPNWVPKTGVPVVAGLWPHVLSLSLLRCHRPHIKRSSCQNVSLINRMNCVHVSGVVHGQSTSR